MRAQHPDLTAALDPFDPARLLGIALRARGAADKGRYCECAEPLTAGLDLMCGACLLNNKDQERRRVIDFVRAHDFVAGEHGSGWICERCTLFEDHERHHGVDGIGRCSWGEELHPPFATADQVGQQ